MELDEIVGGLVHSYGFSDASIDFLKDKGFQSDDFVKLYDVVQLPDQSFKSRRDSKDWLENLLDDGDAIDITGGRYHKYTRPFHDISSEQALVEGRMKFAVEYVIALSDFLMEEAPDNGLVSERFSDEDKGKLRLIYEDFTTKDYAAVKLIERRTGHDIVAANAWVAIQAQRLGLDDQLMRRIIHFARTSADVNTNVMGELYTKAIGMWCDSVSKLVGVLREKAEEYATATCIAETHNQPAQLTTLGHIYANLAEQIRQHAEPLLKEEKVRIDGKIAGAIGTDVDFTAPFTSLVPKDMYRDIVEDIFGLRFQDLGVDQDVSNASLSRALDTMVNVGLVVEKAATDHSIYANRRIVSKVVKKGHSGSSAMPQKANPFLAEGCEALQEIAASMVTPIKKLIVAYRGQGDLRRSITKREGYHPIMLSIIGIERLITELNQYQVNHVGMEAGVYANGVGAVSSALQNYMRDRGVVDAYDRIKDLTEQPIDIQEMFDYIDTSVGTGNFSDTDARIAKDMLRSVQDEDGLLDELDKATTKPQLAAVIGKIELANKDITRRGQVLGTAVDDTYKMIGNAEDTKEKLDRYVPTELAA